MMSTKADSEAKIVYTRCANASHIKFNPHVRINTLG